MGRGELARPMWINCDSRNLEAAPEIVPLPSSLRPYP